MSKISVSFLVGFAIVSSAGLAVAQGTTDAGGMSNSLSSQVLSMDGMRASVKLGEAKPANPFAEAASSLVSGPAGSGTGIDIATVKAKIGGGTDFSMPANSLTDTSRGSAGNMINALQASQPASGDNSLQTTVVLGANVSDLSNSIGDQVRSSQRLGN